MANKDLINLGISPDSGTGDSARRGGEKVNNLFADVYSQFGDNPVGQDPSGPFYGYRRPFFEYEYKVGELHPAGRFIPIEFKSTDSHGRLYDSEWGYGYDSTGTLIGSDSDSVPDIYRDSEWYFLSRGEQIDADFTNVDSDTDIHFVLPIGVPGDQIIIRDGFGTWNNTINNKGIHVNFWTTPFEFQTVDQVTEWERNTGVPGTDLDSDVVSIRDPLSGAFYSSNWHKVKAPAAISNVYPKLDQPFATSRLTDPYDGRSRTYVVDKRRYQFELLFTNYNEGWIIRQVALDAADVGATLLQFGNRLDAVDSDLDKGLYVSADSDVRHTVPIFRRTNDGREIHGTLSLRGDNDAIMTTIDSEDTAMINDPRTSGGGDTVQPLTTTVRFKLRDNVKIKEDLLVGSDLTVGNTLTVRESFSVDSDAVVVNDTFQILDSDGTQRFVFEKARQGQFPDSVKGSGADLLNPNERPTVEPDYALHVKSNAVFGRDSDDVVVFNSRIMSNLVPFGDERYNLGDSDNKWKDLYLAGNTIHLGSIKIKERDGAIFITDSDDKRIDLDGAAFKSDSILVDSDLTVGGNTNFGGRLDVGEHARFDSDVFVAGNVVVVQNLDVEGEIVVKANARFDSDVYIAGNLTAEEDVNLQGHVIMGQSLTVDSDVILSADLRVDSDVIIKGTLSVGQEAHFYDDVFFYDNAEFDSDVLIRGSLTVNGTTTYVNSTNLEVKDNFIVINKNQASPFNDTGIIFQRFDSDSVSAVSYNPVFEWDEAGDKFIIGETDGSGITPNPGVTANYAQFYSSGDVQFFEDTGATPKFHWDASTERLGVGTVNPENPLHLRIDGSTGPTASAATYTDFIQLDQYYADIGSAASGPSIRFSLKDTNNNEAISRIKSLSRNDTVWGDNDEGASNLVFETTDNGVSSDKLFITGDGRVSIGNSPMVASSPFVFDPTGASDPGGAPAGWAGGARPTLTGDGTGVIDGGTF